MNILTMCHSFGRAICAGMVVFICTSAQAQNLFVSGLDGSAYISEITPGGAISPFASGIFNPLALACNKAGDLFATDFPNGLTNNSSGCIYKYTPSGAKSTFASGLVQPVGLAFNGVGDLFVADYGSLQNSGYIYKYTPSGGKSTFATGLNYPLGLAFNSVGDLFVSDADSNNIGTIHEITPDGVQTTFASGLVVADGLAFNSAGVLFVADQGSECIYEFTPDGTRSTFASGLIYPCGLAFQPVPELQAVGTNGVFQLTVSMPSPYISTIIQASTNLLNWVNIYTNTPPFSFTDPTAMTGSRFYRALLGP